MAIGTETLSLVQESWEFGRGSGLPSWNKQTHHPLNRGFIGVYARMYFQKFPFSKILCVLEEYLGLFSWRKAQLKFFVFGPCRQMFPFVICLHGYPLHKKTVSTLDLGTFFKRSCVFQGHSCGSARKRKRQFRKCTGYVVGAWDCI